MKAFVSPQGHGRCTRDPWVKRTGREARALLLRRQILTAAFVRVQCTHAGETQVRTGNISL